MSNRTQHTPTPWHVVDNTQYVEIVVPWKDIPEVVNQYCPTVATVSYEGNDGIDGRANAAFIVRACNSHEQLVAALKLVRHEVGGTHPHSLRSYLPAEVIVRLELALAAAGAP